MTLDNRYSYGWREGRKVREVKPSRKSLLRRGHRIMFWLAAVLGGVSLLFVAGTWIYGMIEPEGDSGPEKPTKAHSSAGSDMRKPSPLSLASLDWSSVDLSDRFSLFQDDVSMIVESTLNPELQQYIRELLERSQTERAAVVALRPDDGRILAMVSYDKNGSDERLCLKADFPAASLFKIVAAAAALEGSGFTPQKTVFYNGRKYTLYKRQLKQTRNKYTRKMPFCKAFGLSINPVFGKLGIYALGRECMVKWGEKFQFNRSIPFDFPLEESFFKVPEHSFGLAEIASGFNKITRISPLHAALLSAAVANDGVMMKPWVVKRILGENGELLFENKPQKLTATMGRDTAQDLKVLMEETVTSGTCRRSFWRMRKKTRFKGVHMGAKTGTINDLSGRYKYDWLTAFVLPPDGKKAFCIAVMGVHGKVLGIRANRLGRYIIDHYMSL